MPINIGYVCDNLTLENIRTNRNVLILNRDKHFIISEAKKLAQQNLEDLIKVLEWNDQNNIKFYRIYSDIFPQIHNHRLLNDPLNYKEFAYDISEFKPLIKQIAKFTKTQRLTFHSTPYVILNSNHFVFTTSLRELYHYSLFFKIGKFPPSSTIVIHVGGVYEDKIQSKKRFIENFNKLPPVISSRLIIENDEFKYNANDVLELCKIIKRPMCFDYFHYCCYEIYRRDKKMPKQSSLKKLIPQIISHHKQFSFRLKMHLSEQMPGEKLGTHSEFVSEIPSIILKQDLDLMIESKSKEKNIFTLREKYPQIN